MICRNVTYVETHRRDIIILRKKYLKITRPFDIIHME